MNELDVVKMRLNQWREFMVKKGFDRNPGMLVHVWMFMAFANFVLACYPYNFQAIGGWLSVMLALMYQYMERPEDDRKRNYRNFDEYMWSKRLDTESEKDDNNKPDWNTMDESDAQLIQTMLQEKEDEQRK